MASFTANNSYLFIISSVIYFNDAPLSYSGIRSKFSPDEREKQTITTIQSIKNKLPNSKIALIEAGMKKELTKELLSLVDQYIYVGDKFPVTYFSKGKNKGLGEASALYYGSKQIDLKNTDYVFKLSGRYFLSDQFNINSFSSTGFSIKKYTDQMSTRLYGFAVEEFGFWQKCLRKTFSSAFSTKSIEQVLFQKIKSKITSEIETLGVGGYVAPDGTTINE
jgi:hypothetical protein